MASYTHCHAVFALPELLERILLCLPPRSIFGVQRVASCWYAMVTTSKNIRKRLFLEGSGEAKQHWIICEGAGPGVADRSRPVPHRSGPTGWIPSHCYLVKYDESVDPRLVREHMSPARLNPLLRLGRPDGQGDLDEMRHSLAQRLNRGGERVHFTHEMPLSDKGSWRATFLTDPPCSRVDLDLHWAVGGTSSSESFDLIRKKGGLTLGDIVDSALSYPMHLADEKTGKQIGEEEPFRYILGDLEAMLGAPATIATATSISMHMFAIPSDAEWHSVYESVAESIERSVGGSVEGSIGGSMGGAQGQTVATAQTIPALQSSTTPDRRREGGEEGGK